MDEKFEALKAFLHEIDAVTVEELEALTVENCYNNRWEQFEIAGYGYKVLTDTEADEAAREEILSSLWSFNADFILEHTEFYKNSSDREDEVFMDSLTKLQGKICEGANEIVKALISNIDEFVQDAIDADGRGPFISHYDGEEYERSGYYIYQAD